MDLLGRGGDPSRNEAVVVVVAGPSGRIAHGLRCSQPCWRVPHGRGSWQPTFESVHSNLLLRGGAILRWKPLLQAPAAATVQAARLLTPRHSPRLTA